MRINSQHFTSFSFVILVLDQSLYSLSLILSYIEYSRSTLALEEERKRKYRKEKGRKEQGRVWSSGYNDISCKYQVACMISFLVLESMVHACVYLVLLLSMAWVSIGVTMVLSLSFPFLDSDGLMGFLLFGWARFSDGFEVEWGSLKGETKGLGIPRPMIVGLW